jgi:glucose-6-phosphate 1-epimerase
VVLGLNDTAETRALWPHAFDLSLTVTVGPTLHLALTTRNTGDAPFEITQALHSYFAVADIAQVRVTGLDGCSYVDKAKGAEGARQVQAGDVNVDAEVDRVYAGAPDVLGIVDRAAPRHIRLTASGSRTAVVWNPWTEIAASMADMPDDAYRRFICVETANTGEEVLTLDPGDSRTLAVDIASV